MTPQSMLENGSSNLVNFSDNMGGASDSMPKIIHAFSLLPKPKKSNPRIINEISSDPVPKIDSIFSLHNEPNSSSLKNNPSMIMNNKTLSKEMSPDLISIDKLVNLKPLPEGSHLTLNDNKAQENRTFLSNYDKTLYTHFTTQLSSSPTHLLRNGVTSSPPLKGNTDTRNFIKANYNNLLLRMYKKSAQNIIDAQANGSLNKPLSSGCPSIDASNRTHHHSSLHNRSYPYQPTSCLNRVKSLDSTNSNTTPQDYFSLLRTIGSQGNTVKRNSNKVNDLKAHVKAQLNRHLNYKMRNVQPSPSTYYLSSPYPMDVNPYMGQQVNYSPHQDTSYYNFLKNVYSQRYGPYSNSPEGYSNSKTWLSPNGQALFSPSNLYPSRHQLKELFNKLDDDIAYFEPEVILKELDGPIIVPGLEMIPPSDLRPCTVVLKRLTTKEIEFYTKTKNSKILDVIVIDDDDDDDENINKKSLTLTPNKLPFHTHSAAHLPPQPPQAHGTQNSSNENISNAATMPTLYNLLLSSSKANCPGPSGSSPNCATIDDVQIIPSPTRVPISAATELSPLKPPKMISRKRSKHQKRRPSLARLASPSKKVLSSSSHFGSPAKKTKFSDSEEVSASQTLSVKKTLNFNPIAVPPPLPDVNQDSPTSSNNKTYLLDFLIKPCSVVLERISFL